MGIIAISTFGVIPNQILEVQATLVRDSASVPKCQLPILLSPNRRVNSSQTPCSKLPNLQTISR